MGDYADRQPVCFQHRTLFDMQFHECRCAAGGMKRFCQGLGAPADALDTLGQGFAGRIALRSEEHTSELQSLMRISYAVFCLKKKIKATRYYQSIDYIHTT